MTPFTTVYDAFLSKILEDEWGYWTEEEVKRDLKTLLLAAIPWFKFPKVDLEIIKDEDGEDAFAGDLSNTEVQILATYMKCEWVNRSILTWENIKPLYEERDFSQANLLTKLNETLEIEKANAKRLEALYYRARERKSYLYRHLAGDAYV